MILMEDLEKLWRIFILLPIAFLGSLACAFALSIFIMDIQYALKPAAWVLLSASGVFGLIVAMIVFISFKVLKSSMIDQQPETEQCAPLIYITNISDLVSDT